MTLKAYAVGIFIAACVLLVWALCRIAGRSDREMDRVFTRREMDQEMENDKWWGLG